MLLLALQYWSGDYDKAMRLARRIAEIEKNYRRDVQFLFVQRFDAPAPDKGTLFALEGRMEVGVYKTKRRGTGHPGGCNDMWHDLVGEMWRRHLQERGFSGKFSGVFSFEADNVPMRADWLNWLIAEWEKARASGSLVWGCYMENPAPHINGNMTWVPDLFGRVKGLEGCATFVAWDVFHAPKWLAKSAKAEGFANFYRAEGVAKNRVFDGKGKAKYALVHGVKDDSVWDAALKRF